MCSNLRWVNTKQKPDSFYDSEDEAMEDSPTKADRPDEDDLESINMVEDDEDEDDEDNNIPDW
jgi:hypothetical protein